MSRQCVNFEDMYRALEAFRKENGHCRVQSNWKRNPQLGRWVAMQRYRRKIGELPADLIARLDKLGFVWSPTDINWDSLCARLVQFKKRRGHCDVPSVWPEDPSLASWVANQRHRKKTGTLAPERAKRLDDLGFVWQLYGKKGVKAKVEKAEPLRALPAPEAVEERLYHLCGEYVQYGGAGDLPAKLDKYIRQHSNEFPPYIPLPRRPLTFLIQRDGAAKGRRVKWTGRGALPEDVIEFVNEHGVLPPQV